MSCFFRILRYYDYCYVAVLTVTVTVTVLVLILTKVCVRVPVRVEILGSVSPGLANVFRYWTSYRASKLYVLNLYVLEGFIDMSDDWDNHVDQVW